MTSELRITASLSELQQQATDPRLHRIATLARIANSLRFAQIAGRDGDPTSTQGNRQQTSSLLYVCALLFEGLQFADRLGRDFAKSAAFKANFAVLLGDANVKIIRNGVLARLRNQAVFHHDDEVFESGLSYVSEADVVFFRSDTRKPSSYFYELADIAVLRFALGSSSEPDVLSQQVTALMVDVAAIGQKYAVAADLLIKETLIDLGWKWESPPGWS